MSTKPSLRGAITYELETNFGEDVDTTATLRLPNVGMVDTSELIWERVDSQRTTQRRNERTPWNYGAKGGRFKVKLELPGHGSSTAGAGLAKTGLETFLGYMLGTSLLSAAAGDTITGGTQTIPTTTGANGFANGSLCRIGSLGDGDGNGQWAVVGGHAANGLTLLTDIDDDPANGAVLYGATNMHTNESDYSISSFRFLLQTVSLQYLTHGTVPVAWAFSPFTAGGIPTVEITFECSWWEYKASTYPNPTATETAQPGPIAAGSVFVNAVGTSTRNKRTARDLTIEYTLGVQLLPGPGGVNEYQKYVGAVRTGDEIRWTWTEDADNATTTPVLPSYNTPRHILASLNVVAGKAIGMYSPYVVPTEEPIQVSVNGINSLRWTGLAGTGPTVDSELEASAFRMAFA